MTHEPGEPPSPFEFVAIAPRWHTAALLALMLAVDITGLWLGAKAPTVATPAAVGSRFTSVYLPMIAIQCGLAFYVTRLGLRANMTRVLVGEGWRSASRFIGDLALAALGFGLIEAGEMAAASLFGVRHAATIATILPQTLSERAVWAVLAIVVGVSEELVYRGYLQNQLRAFTHRASLGVLLQAALFGLAHGEQGAGPALRFAAYGAGLGALAHWRRSLLPGMMCHVALDLVSGLLAR